MACTTPPQPPPRVSREKLNTLARVHTKMDYHPTRADVSALLAAVRARDAILHNLIDAYEVYTKDGATVPLLQVIAVAAATAKQLDR